MAGEFALYSMDIGPTLEPWAEGWSPKPALCIRWDNSVASEDYTPPRRVRRGSITRTGGGNVVTDMGVVASDARIQASGSPGAGTWISLNTGKALQTAYEDEDAQYYFTDGHRVWRVRFLPGDDNAFDFALDLTWYYGRGEEVCRWSMVMMVLGEMAPVGPPQAET
ncbi:MAG: hypothetical protein U1E22_01575 [Coriobacteriia bacterium]|nr:hypothetical protein [Coriobacteriia bacterium]